MNRDDGRVFYVDVIRAYAIFLVLLSHAFAGVCYGMNRYSLPIWGVFILLDSVMRLCVPLFVMISGKLILGSNREESYPSFVWRRYAKLIGPFFVWSMIYAFYHAHLEGSPFSLVNSFLQFLQGPTAGHLYFMYIILGLYLFAPLLRAFVRTATTRDLGIFLGLWWGFLAIQFLVPEYAGGGPGLTLLNYGGYFLLGYFLDRTPLLKGRAALLWGISLAIILFNAHQTYLLTRDAEGVLDEKFFGGVTPLVAVYAGAFFLILKNLDWDAFLLRRSWLQRGLTLLSRESYNTYLIHVLFLWAFHSGTLGFVLSQDTGSTPLIGVPLTTLALFVCSLALAGLLKKIPFLGPLFVIP